MKPYLTLDWCVFGPVMIQHRTLTFSDTNGVSSSVSGSVPPFSSLLSSSESWLLLPHNWVSRSLRKSPLFSVLMRRGAMKRPNMKPTPRQSSQYQWRREESLTYWHHQGPPGFHSNWKHRTTGFLKHLRSYNKYDFLLNANCWPVLLSPGGVWQNLLELVSKNCKNDMKLLRYKLHCTCDRWGCL